MAGENDSDPPKKPLDESIVEAVKHQVIYGVGYGKPPQHTRFQPKQSGNPMGRPRKTPDDLKFNDLPSMKVALGTLNKTVKVRDNDGIRELSRIQALIEALYVQAAKGNARSAGLIMDIFRTAEAANARQIKADIDLWSRYKSVMTEQIENAKKAGTPMEPPLPHPDDIEIDYERGPRFLGPLDEAGQARLEETIRYRDAFIMQDVYDRRQRPRTRSENDGPTSAGLLAHVMDRAVPPRLKFSTIDWFLAEAKYEALTKRELVKLLFRTWRKLGKPYARGHVFPPLDIVKREIKMMAEFVQKVDAGELDNDAISRGEFSDAARTFFESHGVKF